MKNDNFIKNEMTVMDKYYDRKYLSSEKLCNSIAIFENISVGIRVGHLTYFISSKFNPFI